MNTIEFNNQILKQDDSWIELLYDHISNAQLQQTTKKILDAEVERRSIHDHLMLTSAFLSKLAYVNVEKDIVNLVSQHAFTIPLNAISFYKPQHTRTKMLVALDHLNNLFVAFTGSVDVHDVQLDVACGLFEKQYYDRGHQLYATIARFEWMFSAIQQILSIAYRCGARRVVFTGHSMGGSSASWAAIHALNLQRQSAPSPHLGTLSVNCYSFAAASFFHEDTRIMIDALEVERQEEPIFTTVLNEFDLVPIMSHHPFILLDFLFIILAAVTLVHSLLYHREQSLSTLILIFIKLPISYYLTKFVDHMYIKFFSIGLLSPNVHLYDSKLNRYKAIEKLEVEDSYKSFFNHFLKLYNFRSLFNQDHSCELYYQRVKSQVLSASHISQLNNLSNNIHNNITTTTSTTSTSTTTNTTTTITTNSIENDSTTIKGESIITINNNDNSNINSSNNNTNINSEMDPIKHLPSTQHIQYLTHPSNFIHEIIEDERITILKKRIIYKGMGILLLIHVLWIILFFFIISL